MTSTADLPVARTAGKLKPGRASLLFGTDRYPASRSASIRFSVDSWDDIVMSQITFLASRVNR